MTGLQHSMHSIKKYIGAYAAVMGGLDALVFGGGIGLNSPLVRALSLEGLEFLGVRLDCFKNRMAIAGMDISMEDAPEMCIRDRDENSPVLRRIGPAALRVDVHLPLIENAGGRDAAL